MPLVERVLRTIHVDHFCYGTARLPFHLQNGILNVALFGCWRGSKILLQS
jgi:hypothetical protein